MRYLVAWFIGAFTYFMAAVASAYDGLLSVIFQPIAAAVVSAAAVLAAFLLGLPLRLSPFRQFWHRAIPGVVLAAALAASGAALLVFCLSPAQLIEHVDPETEEQFLVTRHVGLLVGGYFALVFSIANWPDARRSRLPGA